jgi:hypothetical protein
VVGPVETVFLVVLGVCWLGSLTAQAISYRRSCGERRQLKWLLAGSALAAISFMLPVCMGVAAVSVNEPVAVAGSALAVAAVFNPVRRRVQRVVDRRFNRARYDADRIVAGFAAQLQDAVDVGSVQDELVRAVQQALEPAHITAWKA